MQKELRIFTPIGMLGYSFSEKIFWDTLKQGVDAIILDSGSTDSGPSKLALGKPTVSRKSYERDLALLVAGVHHYQKPLLIGSAGGDGSNTGVDLIVGIVKDIIEREGYRPMKVVHIYSEIDKGIVRTKHKAGLIQPCSHAVPKLKIEDIDDATKIVAQMGMEPWLKAMNQHPDFDIIVGGRTYDPTPYAAFCVFKGITNLGVAHHMGKIMECGALCSTPKSKSALAVIRNDDFEVTPLDPLSRCTEASVAAHTLYEKTRPDILLGPGGALHLETAKYAQLPDARSVRVWGASFVPEEQYTLKLEAGKVVGFHSMCFGGVRDPILISQMDEFLRRGKELVTQHVNYPFELEFRVYGKNAVMGSLELRSETPYEVCVCAHALAATQEEATNVVHVARVYLMHSSYPYQRATAGNYAMPFAPLDIPLGQISEFCIYHLMPVTDPVEHFPIHQQTIQGLKLPSTKLQEILRFTPDPNGHLNPSPVTQAVELVEEKPTSRLELNGQASDKPPTAEGKATSLLHKEPPPGHVFLADLATYIRSKNAGPYELTFDVIFSDEKTKNMVKNTNVLTQATVAQLYGIQEEDIIASLWWDPALAFKATIKRPRVSGGFWEHDAHGSQQHIPLMELAVPVSSSLSSESPPPPHPPPPPQQQQQY